MAHTKQLLDSEDITDFVKAVAVEKDSFTDDNGRTVHYNRIKLTLSNDDEVKVKMSPEAKLGIFYQLKEFDKDIGAK